MTESFALRVQSFVDYLLDPESDNEAVEAIEEFYGITWA